MGGDCRRCGASRIDSQIGLERTPDEYVARMVEVFREVRRVLRADGTLFLNLGDSYCSQGGPEPAQTKWQVSGASDGQNGGKSRSAVSGLKPKDLVGIPWRVAFALQADGWWLREEIVWCKGNGMPESVKDRCTRTHEYVFHLSKSACYYHDWEAISEPCADDTASRYNRGRSDEHKYADGGPGGQTIARSFDHMKQAGHGRRHAGFNDREFAGEPRERRNKRSWWVINTRPFPGAHFAVMPEELAETCIKAGCPEGGMVLDPFAGAGTTGLVALRLGRKFIGIEMNPEYVEMARRRIVDDAPMFNTEVA